MDFTDGPGLYVPNELVLHISKYILKYHFLHVSWTKFDKSMFQIYLAELVSFAPFLCSPLYQELTFARAINFTVIYFKLNNLITSAA